MKSKIRLSFAVERLQLY